MDNKAKKDAYFTWNINTKSTRGKNWYVIVLALFIGIVIWGFFTRQIGLSLIVIFAAGIYFFIDTNSEENMQVVVNGRGFTVGNIFYDYSEILSYSYFHYKGIPVILRLNTTKKIYNTIDLNIDENVFTSLQEILPNFLEEEKNPSLSLTDTLIHKMKL